MILRRRLLLGGGAAALALALPCRAQPQGKVWRIGYLSPSSMASTEWRFAAFRKGLLEYGYVEGKNLVIELRSADDNYERLPALAADLVRIKPDVIVTFGVVGVRAAKEATSAIPIVMANAGDAVASGLVASLARPGGNITGSNWLSLDLYPKRVELLKELLPRARRFAFLMNKSSPMLEPSLAAAERAAATLKVEVQQFAVSGAADLGAALAAVAKARMDALVSQDEPTLVANAGAIVKLAAKHRLPSAAGTTFAEAGGLIGYGPNFEELFRRAAYFVDRIFKGAKPAELPVELPTRFELVINAKTAKQIGVAIPPKLLSRADRVIE